MNEEKIELQDAANEITGRKNWPHGETNHPPRMFNIKLGDTVETVGLSRLLNTAGRVLAGRINASKQNRLRIGNHLLNVNDRLVEFQELYDRTIPREHEYDPEANPQRTENGMMLYVETARSELDHLVDRLVGRVYPFPLTDIMPTANKNDLVLQINGMRVIFPEKNTIVVTCILRTKRREDTEAINVPSVLDIKDLTVKPEEPQVDQGVQANPGSQDTASGLQ